ncbi:cyclododecanone monooxygenase [Gonapodya prolifera JEL478]|uniref:Cyclododecanone monooxygenase n=1 Tax=Gonapodya prolifera (strain JEL478) TaxID=1344416 RepID=A0A139ALE1_GONPJ|nr:cyclododecanone monooxygenase [Gonapodya prolifera JEL478]|eukprot:KXS17607.1 cyclododecanone monooxygenase [Gonapodya prolifera JEL478]
MSKQLEFGFDPVALKAKYLAERDKRLRADGNAQYLGIDKDGMFGRFLEDPYTPPIVRDPRADDVRIAVLGGGFAGLQTAAKIREAGFSSQDVLMIEKGGDFGGTWYWNRYPGAACDTESYIYLPLLEETQFMPEFKYTKAPEILAHCSRIGRKYDLYSNVLFQTEVNELRWDDARERWTIITNKGDRISAQWVVMASGPLHRPKLLGVPGIDSFKGHSFHTSRWDYEYTGGTSLGNLERLSDKVVAIIGTGATSVQCVPHVGENAKHLYVFQRTPSSIDVRNNRPTDPEWFWSQKPGWQKRRMDNFNILVQGGYQEEDLVGDGWTSIFRMMFDVVKAGRKQGLKTSTLLQMADFKKMEEIRARVDSIVKDPETAEALKPYYNQFCKRPCYHDEYLQTFNRENVTLVDTKGKGVTEITEHGIVANGKEYKVDCIIFATGFETGATFTRRNYCNIFGRGGLSLDEYWKDGMRSLHGIWMRNFPNFAIIQNSQAGASVNFPHIIQEQVVLIADVLLKNLRANVKTMEVSEAAVDKWVQECLRVAVLRSSFLEECTPGYYNLEGKIDKRVTQNLAYGAGPIAYAELLHKWQEQNAMATDMEFSYLQQKLEGAGVSARL